MDIYVKGELAYSTFSFGTAHLPNASQSPFLDHVLREVEDFLEGDLNMALGPLPVLLSVG